MVVGVVDQFGIGEAVAGHDLRVPVTRPALVHDLGLSLRREVVRFIADNREDIVLPGREGRVLQQKSQHVALGRLGERAGAVFRFLFQVALLALGREDIGRIDVGVHVLLGLKPRRAVIVILSRFERIDDGPGVWLFPADMRRVRVDQVFDGETGIDKAFDGFVAKAVDVARDARGMISHLVEHLAIGRREPGVVLEEVAVPVDMGDDELLIHHRVTSQ